MRAFFVGAALFAALAVLSFYLVAPDRFSAEPYDAHSSDLHGDKAAREKLDDGSTCFELVGDVHEAQFRLGRCLGERMKGWNEVLGMAVTPVKSREQFEVEVARLRQKNVRGLPVVLDVDSPMFLATIGCHTPHLMGDLADLIEVARMMKSAPPGLSEQTLRAECD
jgi:hypothetical protein